LKVAYEIGDEIVEIVGEIYESDKKLSESGFFHRAYTNKMIYQSCIEKATGM
jgi:hypothetical protein